VRIVLVANASPGEVPAWISSIPNLIFSRQESNLGFAEGNNTGFSISSDNGGTKYTIFLNNDAETAPDTLSELTAYLEEHPEAGIVAPPVYLASSPDRIWSAGGIFNPLKMRFSQHIYSSRSSLPSAPYEVDFVSGCAMMVRSSLFREAGGFPSEYFMYYEDAELCFRVRSRGLSIRVVPCEGVIHQVSAASGGELTNLPVYFSERNRIILSREMLSASQRFRFELYISAVLLVKTLKFLLWQGPGLIPWIWRGYIDGHFVRTDNEAVLRRLAGAG